MIQKITNMEFYRAIEAQVTQGMKTFETEMLPIVQQALKDAKLDDKVDQNMPIEGYYSDTPQLTEYFKAVRTLQSNYSDNIQSEAINKLHSIYTHPVFGLKQGIRTAIQMVNNPDAEIANPIAEPVTVAPVADPVYFASQKIAPNWTIKGIMDSVDMDHVGEGLVGFALYVDKHEGFYNPVATTLAAETTVLSRMKFTFECAIMEPEYEWDVDAEVMAHGEKVVNAYNDMFEKQGFEYRLQTPKDGREVMDWVDVAREPYRVVNLNVSKERPDGFYHWAVRDGENGLEVVDFWAPEIITTQMYQEDRSIINQFLN